MENTFFRNFDEAGTAALKYLHERLGFGLWMLTRAEGEDWIILQSLDHGYGVVPGTVFKWADSFCSQMVKGNGPRISPDSALVPAYAAAPIGQSVPIRAYIGIPLLDSNQKLFGTLCAIDPSPKNISIESELAQVELVAALLSTILRAELKSEADSRKLEKIHLESRTDSLTSLFNRRAWDEFLVSEEARCRRHGHPAVILSIDIDDLKVVNDSAGHGEGDALIVRAAKALYGSARETDFVARLGGDEFGIIGVECNHAASDGLYARVKASLVESGVKASVGLAARTSQGGLAGAWGRADERMYDEKRSR